MLSILLDLQMQLLMMFRQKQHIDLHPKKYKRNDDCRAGLVRPARPGTTHSRPLRILAVSGRELGLTSLLTPHSPDQTTIFLCQR